MNQRRQRRYITHQFNIIYDNAKKKIVLMRKLLLHCPFISNKVHWLSWSESEREKIHTAQPTQSEPPVNVNISHYMAMQRPHSLIIYPIKIFSQHFFPSIFQTYKFYLLHEHLFEKRWLSHTRPSSLFMTFRPLKWRFCANAFTKMCV